MEPFVAEKEERISDSTPVNRPHKSGNRPLPSALLILVLVIVGGALVTMLYLQQRSFDSLKDNFLSLQSRLENQPGDETEESAPKEETGTANKPSPADIPDISGLEKKFNTLENSLSGLNQKINRVENKISSGTTSTEANLKPLTDATAKLRSDLNGLRDEVFAMKLTLNELEADNGAWQNNIGRRLDSMERAVMSLNEFRRSASAGSGGTDSRALEEIRRDIELLRQQHPYLKD